MKNNTIKWLYQVQGRKNILILILVILHAVLGGSGVLYAILLRNIVDRATEHDPYEFWKSVILIILLVLFQLIICAIIRWLNEYSRTTFENNLKLRVAKCILRKDYASVSALHSAEWLNRITSDTVIVANGYVDILPGLAGMVVKLVSALIMIIALDKWFAYILLPGGMVVVFLTYAFRKVLKKLHKNVQEADGKLRIFLQERIGSLIMIKSFAAESQTEDSLKEKLSGHKNARMKRNRFSNFCNFGFGAAMNGMYLIGIIYCGYGILNNTITYGTLTAITQLIAQIQSPFANISGYLPRYYAVIASAERLIEAEKFNDDVTEGAFDLEYINKFYENSLASFGLKNSEFSYYPAAESVEGLLKDDMPVVLKDISLNINKGDYIAFTGQSGCGKSTVLKLLMCIYDLDGGKRYITDSSGNECDLSAKWRRLFAYVPQGNQLISGTIREIVSFSSPNDSNDEERIMKAIKIACADEFVSELENGIDTLLGERGTGLSEGQMQRIAIARAVFSQSPVLLFDEATSSLDENTEKELLQNLRKLTNKTVIIVTHRPAVLSICDRVLNFTENGIEIINRCLA